MKALVEMALSGHTPFHHITYNLVTIPNKLIFILELFFFFLITCGFMSTENLSSFAYFKAYQGSLPTPRLPEVYVHKIVSDLVLLR